MFQPIIFYLEFTPCKAEQPVGGMELQEKKFTERLKHTRNLFRKKLQLKLLLILYF